MIFHYWLDLCITLSITGAGGNMTTDIQKLSICIKERREGVGIPQTTQLPLFIYITERERKGKAKVTSHHGQGQPRGARPRVWNSAGANPGLWLGNFNGFCYYYRTSISTEDSTALRWWALSLTRIRSRTFCMYSAADSQQCLDCISRARA